jgi:hypothetical protein
MGDRANFGFKQSNGETIVLYGHWAGHQMLANLADAVSAAEPRWTDESYATRIAISQLVGKEWTSETGWGLSVNRILDNEHKIPIIDWEKKTFSLHEEEPWSEDGNQFKVRGMQDEPIFTMTLENFVSKYSSQLSMV